MSHAFRRESGGLIERGAALRFRFDNAEYSGFAGDTLASALLANGVRLVGRSFKYHRPRGIFSAGPEEPNALVELREGAAREPNTRATVIELYDGLVSRSQNRFPSLRFDVMAVNGMLSPIFAAGFYYKTFMWPASFWERVYEPLIRRAAGLGRASGLPDPDSYEKQSVFADVLVIGGGAAGLSAALAAAKAGCDVVLAEQDFALGGRLLAERDMVEGTSGVDWARDAVARLRSLPNVRVLTRTTVFGCFDSGTYGAVERVADHLAVPGVLPRQRLWRIIAARSVLATGAIERPLVFDGNDLPGVMLAGAVRTYVNRFAVKPGTRAVVFANSDDGIRTAADLADAGVGVAALVEARPDVPQTVLHEARDLDVAVYAAARVTAAKGGLALKGVVLGGSAAGTYIACDLLAVSGGWNPVVHLASHHGAKPVWHERVAAFVPDGMPPGMRAAGAVAARFSARDAVLSGRLAGREAAGFPDEAAPNWGEDFAITPVWDVGGKAGKAFVDLQNDVTASDISQAAREGFTSVEHLKRYTTLGMATDQGKTSNVTGLAMLAALTQRSIPQTGTTVFRPPFTPVALGAMAGAHTGVQFRPTRRTPAHDWAAREGAVFTDAGQWVRAAYFPQAGETEFWSIVNREVRGVRAGCGFCDVSTLGKIDVQGPNAGVFLDFIYANAISGLAAGKVRYGLMLREDGFVFDDGTVARLARSHFLLTTTTANAGRVLRHLDFCARVLRPELAVAVEPVTEQWAQFAVAGPQARAILQRLVDDAAAVSAEALPFMGMTETRLRSGAIAARVFRISFSGELAYEIAVAARHGETLAQALLEAGAMPYGLEALNVLRLEKGHPVGAELNGQTTAADLGLGGMLSKKKDFVGRVLSLRPALLDADRQTLVGIRPVAGGAALQSGAHLVPQGEAATAANDKGHVTSVAYSATFGHWIGLALLEGGARHEGRIFRAVNPVMGEETEVVIVPKVFHDPEGRAVHG
jgi:heterotetrameric sarcosine oxidase alpha subunit